MAPYQETKEWSRDASARDSLVWLELVNRQAERTDCRVRRLRSNSDSAARRIYPAFARRRHCEDPHAAARFGPVRRYFCPTRDVLTIIREHQTFSVFGATGRNAQIPFG
jgi:hypothetical protein